MDFQNRPGGKTGGGGVASWSESNRDRRERLRQLALETIDLNKDPYFMKNHLGTYECKLCLTLHNNEGSYLAHTQGKKHQANLARRAAKEARDAPAQPAPEKARVDVKKFVKIGRPGYRVTKQKEAESGQQSLLFQIDYPEIAEGVLPRHRFMSAYEQRIEPPDRRWQYLLFAAEPYETIAFKVPSREVDKSEKKFWTMWNKDTKQFFLQFSYKLEPKKPPPPQIIPANLPAPPRPAPTPTPTPMLAPSPAPSPMPPMVPPPPPHMRPGMPPRPQMFGPPGMMPPRPGMGPPGMGPPGPGMGPPGPGMAPPGPGMGGPPPPPGGMMPPRMGGPPMPMGMMPPRPPMGFNPMPPPPPNMGGVPPPPRG